MNFIGAVKLSKKFIALADSVSDAEFKNAVAKVNKGVVQANAKLLAPVSSGTGGGELRESIKSSVKQISTGVVATTFTNKKYASYVEFGTGPIGQVNHQGISPEVSPSYVQHGWGIPADKVDSNDAEMYHWPKRTYNGKDYYMTSGQPAHPFLYPALKNNEKIVKQEIANDLVRRIRKEAKK